MYSTAILALKFELFQEINKGKVDVATALGIKPGTYSSQVQNFIK